MGVAAPLSEAGAVCDDDGHREMIESVRWRLAIEKQWD